MSVKEFTAFLMTHSFTLYQSSHSSRSLLAAHAVFSHILSQMAGWTMSSWWTERCVYLCLVKWSPGENIYPSKVEWGDRMSWQIPRFFEGRYNGIHCTGFYFPRFLFRCPNIIWVFKGRTVLICLELEAFLRRLDILPKLILSWIGVNLGH